MHLPRSCLDRSYAALQRRRLVTQIIATRTDLRFEPARPGSGGAAPCRGRPSAVQPPRDHPGSVMTVRSPGRVAVGALRGRGARRPGPPPAGHCSRSAHARQGRDDGGGQVDAAGVPLKVHGTVGQAHGGRTRADRRRGSSGSSRRAAGIHSPIRYRICATNLPYNLANADIKAL